MKEQLFGLLRNVVVYSVILALGLVVYSVFFLRGRCCAFAEETDDLTLQLLTRYNHTPQTAYDYASPSPHLVYSLTELADARYERRITNESWRPFLVTIYEFKEWQYELPDEMLLRYAGRYVIKNQRTDLKIDSGFGFNCGSGLGMTLIRPWERFVDTVDFKGLMPFVSIGDQLAFPDDNFAFDRLTGTRIGDPSRERSQYKETSLPAMLPNDALEVRLYLPVMDYFTGEPARVYANGFLIGRWEMLERMATRRTEMMTGFAD